MVMVDIYEAYQPEYCWWCAGELKLLGNGNKWYVHCKLCGRTGPYGDSPDIAVDRWNQIEYTLKRFSVVLKAFSDNISN
jgi:hypothetical protein